MVPSDSDQMAASREQPEFDVKSISSSASDGNGVSLNEIQDLPVRGKDTKEELPSLGMMCTVKNLWEGEKVCECCINWVEECPDDAKPNPEETEAVLQHALIVRNRRNHESTGRAMEVGSVIVQSPLLKNLLEEVFEDYEGITATLKKVAFSKPFAPFFYRWSRFKKAVEEVEDEKTRAHANLLYGVISKELEETISTYQDLLAHGVMTYKFLWTLFKPGDIIVAQFMGEEMIMKLEDSAFTDDKAKSQFRLSCKYVDWNGHYFGYASQYLYIDRFDGTRPITDLRAYPIQFNSEGVELQARLAARGKKFEMLQGVHYKAYKGVAGLQPSDMTAEFKAKPRNRKVEGRIIIDAEMYNRFNNVYGTSLAPLDSITFAPNIPTETENIHHDDSGPMPPPPPPHPPLPPHMVPPPPPPPPQASPQSFSLEAHQPCQEEPQILSEDLYPLCTPIVKGYNLKTKNWAVFGIEGIQEIRWDDRAFDGLVLPQGHKDLVKSFTQNQNPDEGLVDDMIEGKGQGMVMLLSGEPGVGKTLTAEAVAEHMRAPLYSMSAAQLGVDSFRVEQSLADILEMVTKWKAILLLDETEVFLEQRTIDGLERNKLVSIFLRMLEYYRGVLFLTTNRVTVLDKALESRIHLKIRYPELDRAARLQVWRNLLELMPASQVGLNSADLEILADKEMNGREIKNVLKTGRLLAHGDSLPLTLGHIQTVLRISQIDGTVAAQA